jgi:sugar lactone lactonase YvrE
MLRFICRGLGIWLAAFSVLNGIGCGGASSPASGGSTTTPVQTTSQVVTAIISVNVTTGQVTVKPTVATGRTLFTGPTLAMTASTLQNQAGSPGNKTTLVSITNNSSLPIGIDPNGNVTGLRVIFGAVTVTGGSSSDPVELSNPTGLLPNGSSSGDLPYISYPAQIAPSKTSPAQNWTFSVPSGITAFNFSVSIEADNSYLAQAQGLSGAGSASNYVRTLAGQTSSGYATGNAANARFNLCFGVALDAADNLFVSDCNNGVIRRITPSGTVSTIAGNPFAIGSTNGAGNVAEFYLPEGLAVTPDGSTVYVADFGNNSIRRLALNPNADPTNSANWNVTTIAGSSSTRGGAYLNSNGSTSTLNYPSGLALDASGNIYFSEVSGNRIREVSYLGGDPSSASNWEVLLIAGDYSSVYGASGDVDGNGSTARFGNPRGVAVDLAGNVYVADTGNSRIREISPNEAVSTLAGGTSGSNVTLSYQDGPGASAAFSGPFGVTVDRTGMVYVSEAYNLRIREITQAGNVTTVAGNGSGGFVNGSGNVAEFALPYFITVSSSGTLYVADDYQIRVVERNNSQ